MKLPTLNSEQVIAAARRYVGAPYVKYGRSREGLDCVGLILVVGAEFGIYPQVPRYRPLNPVEWTRSFIHQFAFEVPRETPGSIAWYGTRPGVPTHFGFFSLIDGRPGIIHSDPEMGRVVEHGIPKEQLKLLDSFYWFK